MTRLTDDQLAFLREPNFAVVATVGADGTPQSSVVWIDTDGENVVFNTTRPRAKGRNLETHPVASVTIVDRNDGYRYLEVQGPVELVDEGANEHIGLLSHKYRGEDFADPTGRVIVRVRPERVLDHLG